MAGAPKGNNNSNKDNRLWANTIRRAIKQGDPDRLRRIAEKLLEEAEEGNLAAMAMLGDRLDGKATATVDLNTNATVLVDLSGGELVAEESDDDGSTP